jgi:hypothetical protein
MRPIWKYLIGICGFFIVFFLYFNIGKIHKTEGIDVIEVNDNINLSQQTQHKPPTTHSQHSKKRLVSHHKSKQKIHPVKYISLEAFINQTAQIPLVVVEYNEPIYSYQEYYLPRFFKEINPPPPRLG